MQKIDRKNHNISRQNIDSNALEIINKLNINGFDGFIVGGAVRDLLLCKQPKDFDIVTDAKPGQIKKIFKNSRIIGRRFLLVHIYFARQIIEVATFRATEIDNQNFSQNQRGMITRDNVYGNITEDAKRRDFTINSLYYNPKTQEVLDFSTGFSDIKKKQVTLIGDPKKRFLEDPVRMIRAIRFVTKLNMLVQKNTKIEIIKNAHLLTTVAKARLFEEVNKMFLNVCAKENFNSLIEYGLFFKLFPALKTPLKEDTIQKFFLTSFANTKSRLEDNKSITPAFLYAVFLWPLVKNMQKNTIEDLKLSEFDALVFSANQVLCPKRLSIMIPKRFSLAIKEIWVMQLGFATRNIKRVEKILAKSRFRAAYDFLLLRSTIKNELEDDAVWWTKIQEIPYKERKNFIVNSQK